MNIPNAPQSTNQAAADVVMERRMPLTQENERLHKLLENERLARTALEKELLTTKSMLREANEASARIKRMLSWRLGQALLQVDSVWDAIRLPWTIRKIVVDFQRTRRRVSSPTAAGQGSAAETAYAIKQTLLQAQVSGYGSMVDWIAQQKWRAPVAARALAELARRAHKHAPDAALTFAARAQELDPSSPPVRHLSFALFDAGLIKESAKLLRRNKKGSEELSNSEARKATQIQQLIANNGTLRLPTRKGAAHVAKTDPASFLIITSDSIVRNYTAESIALHEGLRRLCSHKFRPAVVTVATGNPEREGSAASQSGPLTKTIDGVLYMEIQGSIASDGDLSAYAEQIASQLVTIARSHSASAIFSESGAKTAYAAAFAARVAGIPHLLCVDALDSHNAADTLRTIANECEAIMTASPHLRSMLFTLKFQPRLLLLGTLHQPSQVDFNLHPRALSGSRHTIQLGYTVAIMPRLVAHYLVDLLAEIRASGLDASLTVLGSTGTAALRQYAAERELAQHIVIKEQFSSMAERYSALRALDLVIFPSPSGQRPATASPSVFAILEAMAHGCCTMSANIPAYAELVEDGVNGVLVDPMAPIQTHTQKIRELVGSPTLHGIAQQAHGMARNRAETDQSIDTVRNLLAHVNHPGAALAQNVVIH